MWLMNTCVWQQSANSAHRIIRATVLICNAIHISSALEQRHHTLNVLLINVIVFIESEQMWMSGQKQQVAGSLTSLSSSLTSCLEAHLILATSHLPKDSDARWAASTHDLFDVISCKLLRRFLVGRNSVCSCSRWGRGGSCCWKQSLTLEINWFYKKYPLCLFVPWEEF